MLDYLTTWFAYPALLGAFLLLPLLIVLLFYARRRRLQAFALLGQTEALHKLRSNSWFMRFVRTLCLFLGLTLLILGTAGPRWGKAPSPVAQRPKRDLVLVLDVSRSMLAGQPSRQDLARRALRNLAGTLTDNGGPRLALVIFAAHARLAFPLTNDYDYLLDALSRIDADDLPPALRPRSDDSTTSGTRIGEALRVAVQSLDAKTGGDILLLSDGDDPAGDEEWRAGAEEARRRNIPVHTICLGDPTGEYSIPWAGGVLQFAGRPVKTRVNEATLKEIARRTHGSYVPAFMENLPLGKLLPSILSNRPDESEEEAAQSLPVWQPRYVWFLAPSLLFLVLALLGTDRRSIYLPAPARVAFLLPLLCLVSAASFPDALALLRFGNEAYDRGQDNEALKYFEEAEDFTADPALVSFNKAAALYRLERFGEAALHYQRCLEDGTIPAMRKARAYFQMGNACIRDSRGNNRSLLEKAIDAYRFCLLMKETDADLRGDVRHNLELARLLWLKALPNPDDPSQDRPPFPNIGKSNEPDSKKEPVPPKNSQSEVKSADPGVHDTADTAKGAAGHKSTKAQTGPITVLPDNSELVPLSPQETEAILEDISQRILQDHRQYRRHAVTVPDHVKDW
jgi:Ca-activated chloride channel homolog